MGRLENSSILPIISEPESLGNGGYGEVWKVVIHPDHLENAPVLIVSPLKCLNFSLIQMLVLM